MDTFELKGFLRPLACYRKNQVMGFAITSYSLRVGSTQTVSAEVYIPETPKSIFVFAHGAGAGMQHPFITGLAKELAHHQIATLRYNFPFMEQKKKRPDVPVIAHRAVQAAIEAAHHYYPGLPLFVGGKSFGGRMTSQFISDNPLEFVRGLIFVGFPLHPAGTPTMDRAEHLQRIRKPMLFLQGTRDTLAEWPLIKKVCAALPSATLIRLEGADHGFKMKDVNAIQILAAEIGRWMEGL
jgi:predicted alpha/beta-hydrolase family hydrolase